jgi:hypothetical protein
MKITIDLENKVIGKSLMDYIKGSIDNLATMMQLDCKIEIVGYEARQDTQEDVDLFEIVAAIHKQTIIHFEYSTISPENMPKPNPKNIKYDC